MIAGAPTMVRPVFAQQAPPGLPIQTSGGLWTTVSFPNVVPIVNSEDQRVRWRYHDTWAEQVAESSFAGALMLRRHYAAS